MSIPPGTIEAVALYLVRTSAMVLFTPIFGEAASFEGYKIALIAVLSLLLYSLLGSPLQGEIEPLAFIAMALRESLIGLFLAFVVRGLLLSTAVAGELIGNEMGFSIAGQADPVTGISTPLISRLHEILTILGLFALNAHHWLIQALADTFRHAPVGSLHVSGNLAGMAVTLLGQMFAAGISFAAPTLVLLFMISLLLGLLARAVPALNIMEAGFTLRIAGGLFAMYAFAPVLAPALERLYARVQVFLDGAIQSLGT